MCERVCVNTCEDGLDCALAASHPKKPFYDLVPPLKNADSHHGRENKVTGFHNECMGTQRLLTGAAIII